MGLSAFSVGFSVMVLGFHHHHTKERPHAMVRYVVYTWLSRAVCMSKQIEEYTAEDINAISKEPGHFYDTVFSVKEPIIDNKSNGFEHHRQAFAWESEHDRRQANTIKSVTSADEKAFREEWVTMARVIDRFLFMIFIIINVLVTVAVLIAITT